MSLEHSPARQGSDGAADRLGDDLIVGCRAIAEFLGFTENEVRWHIAKGRIPVVRMGMLHVARRSTLTKFFTPENA